MAKVTIYDVNFVNRFFRLKRPIKIYGNNCYIRNVVFVLLKDKFGNIGTGEAVNPKDVLQCDDFLFSNALNWWKRYLPKRTFEGTPRKILKTLNKEGEFLSSPSVHFAVETAVLNLIGKNCGKTIFQLLQDKNSRPSHNYNAKISKLLMGSREEIIAKAKSIFKSGVKTAKIKAVGNLEDSMDLVNAVNDIFGGNVSLKIDVNQKWSLENALEFVKKMRHVNLEYIEEPVANYEEALEFIKYSKIPMGLDETLQTVDGKDMIRNYPVKVIFKPSAIGGIYKTLIFKKLCKSHNREMFISSCFETVFGLGVLSQLSSAMLPGNYVGIDTFDIFENANIC